jgi:hypothetical protein
MKQNKESVMAVFSTGYVNLFSLPTGTYILIKILLDYTTYVNKDWF